MTALAKEEFIRGSDTIILDRKINIEKSKKVVHNHQNYY